jgi:hypothetical protein
MARQIKTVNVQFPQGMDPFNDKVYVARLADAERNLYVIDLDSRKSFEELGETRERGYRSPRTRYLERPVGEELIIALPPPMNGGPPRWKEYNLIPLNKTGIEYRGTKTEYENPSEFFGGYNNHIKVFEKVNGRHMPEIETWPTNAPAGTKKGAPKGGYMSAGLAPFFERHQELQADDRILFRRIGEDRYTVKVQMQGTRPRFAPRSATKQSTD